MSLGCLSLPALVAPRTAARSAVPPVAGAAPLQFGGGCACGRACKCAAQLRGAALSLRRGCFTPSQAGRGQRLSVSAQAAAAAPAAPGYSVLNQRGAPLTPPSAGAAPPVWHAIIEVGGAQQIVSEGRFYSCHSLPQVQAGQKIVFERVLATKQPGSNALKVGHPYVQGARVHATVLENYKDKKIIVFKMKAKKHYRRKAGHRQHMSRFLVTKVEFGN